MKALLKRWMYAQMYGAYTPLYKRIGICIYLWQVRGFTLKASWYCTNNPSQVVRRNP